MILGDCFAEFIVSNAPIGECVVISEWVVEKPQPSMREVQADGADSMLFGREEVKAESSLCGSPPVQRGPLRSDLLFVIGVKRPLLLVVKASF